MASFPVRGRLNRDRSPSPSMCRPESRATTTSLRHSMPRRSARRLVSRIGQAHSFAIDLARHRLKGPDPLRAERYARRRQLRQSLWQSAAPADTRPDATAFFWFEPFEIWNDIATTAIERQHVDPWKAARVLALMNFALTDAGIACFDDKYHFRFWRPYTAIRRAGEDGNDGTEPDPDWLPLLWTPPGEPLTVPHSADSGLSVSGSHDFRRSGRSVDGAPGRFTCTFEVTSPTLPGAHDGSELRHAAHEAGMSRVYGGIHFVHAVEDGCAGQGHRPGCESKASSRSAMTR